MPVELELKALGLSQSDLDYLKKEKVFIDFESQKFESSINSSQISSEIP